MLFYVGPDSDFAPHPGMKVEAQTGEEAVRKYVSERGAQAGDVFYAAPVEVFAWFAVGGVDPVPAPAYDPTAGA